MQKKTVVFAGTVVCLIILAATGFYLYQKPRRSLTNVKPAYILNATDLYNAFRQNEQKSNQQYMGKVIQVTGTIDNIQATDSTLIILLSSGNVMGGVNCSVVKNKTEQKTVPVKGATVQLKGRCVGFLMDVNLVDCVVVTS